jgi:cytochrome c-type biogenesis protein CcmH/NrfG
MAKDYRVRTPSGSRIAPARSNTAGPATVVIVGAVCLAVGLAAGFYFGRQASPALPVAEAPPGTVPNPAAFLQDEAALKMALQASPNDLNTMVRLGNLYYDQGRFRDASDWYGRALERDPKNVGVRTDRGTSLWSLGQADAAIAEFQKSLEIEPSHPQTLYNLGVVQLNGKNNPQEARKAWEKLLATNPNYPERAKVEEQLASLSAGSAGPEVTRQQKSASPGVEELLQKIKTRP